MYLMRWHKKKLLAYLLLTCHNKIYIYHVVLCFRAENIDWLRFLTARQGCILSPTMQSCNIYILLFHRLMKFYHPLNNRVCMVFHYSARVSGKCCCAFCWYCSHIQYTKGYPEPPQCDQFSLQTSFSQHKSADKTKFMVFRNQRFWGKHYVMVWSGRRTGHRQRSQ